MTIPTPDSFDALAFHCLITRNYIFYDTAKKCAMVWYTSNKRWTIVKNERIFDWSHRNRFLEYFIFLPLLHQIFFIFKCTSASTRFELHYANKPFPYFTIIMTIDATINKANANLSKSFRIKFLPRAASSFDKYRLSSRILNLVIEKNITVADNITSRHHGHNDWITNVLIKNR